MAVRGREIKHLNNLNIIEIIFNLQKDVMEAHCITSHC